MVNTVPCRRIFVFLFLLATMTPASALQAGDNMFPRVGNIERLHSDIDALIPEDATIEVPQWVLLGRKTVWIQMQMGSSSTLCCLVTFLTTEFIAGTQKTDSLSFLNLPDLLARQVTAGNEEATVSHLIEKADSFAANMAIEGSACLKKMVVNERLPTHGTASDSTA